VQEYHFQTGSIFIFLSTTIIVKTCRGHGHGSQRVTRMSVCTRAYERREQIPFAHVAAVLCFPEVKSSGVSGTDATPAHARTAWMYQSWAMPCRPGVAHGQLRGHLAVCCQGVSSRVLAIAFILFYLLSISLKVN
jgi:hypothetical protein